MSKLAAFLAVYVIALSLGCLLVAWVHDVGHFVGQMDVRHSAPAYVPMTELAQYGFKGTVS